MRSMLLTAALLTLSFSPALAGPAPEKACCACEPMTSGPALFCRRISIDDANALREECKAQGGSFVCNALTVGDSVCTFQNLECPAAPAPAMDSASLGALVVVLAGVGIGTVRRRSRR